MGGIAKRILEGGATRRFHTVPTITVNSVGEHSFGVAMFCYVLAQGSDMEVSTDLLMAALTHDMAEHLVGDVPAPTKRMNPDLGKLFNEMEDGLLNEMGLGFAHHLGETESIILKLADCMDGMLFCIRERRMGNTNVVTSFNNFNSYIVGLIPKIRGSEAIHAQILRLWHNCHTYPGASL